MKYTLTAKSPDGDSTVTVRFEADSLSELLDQFGRFLRGVGFVFEGDVDIVDGLP